MKYLGLITPSHTDLSPSGAGFVTERESITGKIFITGNITCLVREYEGCLYY